MNKANRVSHLPARMTDAEACERAKQLYIDCHVVRWERIARDVCRPVDLVKQWMADGHWFELRQSAQHERNERKVAELKRLVGKIQSKEESAVMYIKTCKKIVGMVSVLASEKDKNNMTAQTPKALAEAMKVVQEVMGNAHDKLKGVA